MSPIDFPLLKQYNNLTTISLTTDLHLALIDYREKGEIAMLQ
jgi:hypothetical protein